LAAYISHLADVAVPSCAQIGGMTRRTNPRAAPAAASGTFPHGTERAGRFPGTDLPKGATLILVAIGLPRTILADLDVVEPESGPVYYVLALAPFVVWLVVAVMRTSRRPFLDFVVVGLLYGLSLVVVHQALWEVGPSLGHHPPASAVDFANRFDGAGRELALRVYTTGIAMVIGLGTGLVTGLVGFGADLVRRSRRLRRGRSRS
jgi:hypothetical protein